MEKYLKNKTKKRMPRKTSNSVFLDFATGFKNLQNIKNFEF